MLIKTTSLVLSNTYMVRRNEIKRTKLTDQFEFIVTDWCVIQTLFIKIENDKINHSLFDREYIRNI